MAGQFMYVVRYGYDQKVAGTSVYVLLALH